MDIKYLIKDSNSRKKSQLSAIWPRPVVIFVTMLSALFLINAKGEIIIYRLYRDDVSLSAANAFRLQVIAAKEAGASAPVRSIDGNTFLYVRHKDMFFVAVTRSNSNAGE